MKRGGNLMELNQLKTFQTIVMTGSFSKASQRLGYSQAAVTIQIKNLEEELNCRLFDRLGRTISLTDDGRTFYRHVNAILKEVEEAKASLSTEELSGHLRIGTIDSLCTSLLDASLLSFHKKYPHVTFTITTDSIDGLLNKLFSNDIDFAYLVDQKISDSHLTTVYDCKEEACFVACATHPFVKRKHLSLEEITQEPLILTEPNASYRRLLDIDLASRQIMIEPVIEAENTDLIISLVKGTDGITFLPNYILYPHLKAGTLVKLDVNYRIPLSRQILYHKDKWISKEMKSFIEELKRI
jgi:DNA-binding transcriptional LysR family regulator